MKSLVVVLAVAALSGCTSLSPMPLATQADSPTCDKNDKSLAGELCAKLAGPVGTASTYQKRYDSIGFERLLLDGLVITSAVAATGFGVFDAHPDNILAATLVGGTAGVLRGGLKQTDELRILRGGYSSMSCFVTQGATMFAIYKTPTISRGEIFTRRNALQNLVSDVTSTPLPVPANAAEQTDADLIATLLVRARAMVDTAEQAANAYAGFTTQFEKSYATATANIATRTDSLDINASALATRIGELATEISKKSASPAAPAPAPAGTPTRAQFIARLNLAMARMEEMQPGQIVSAFNELAVCVAQSAG